MTTASPISLAPITPSQGVRAALPDRPVQRPAVHVAPLSYRGVVRSEWIKATSLRSVRWTILLTVLLGAGMAAMMAFAMRGMVPDTDAGLTEYLTAVAGFPANLLALVFGVLGVFLFSSEYASGMILSSLAVAPKRGLFFAGKATVVALISAGVAAVTVALSGLIAVLVLPESASVLNSTQVWTGFAGAVFMLAVVALMSFAFAGLLRSTAGAITLAVILLLVAPTVLFMVSSFTDWTWLAEVAKLLPMDLGQRVAMGLSESASASAAAGGLIESYWGALGVLVAWAVIPLTVALVSFRVRDAK